MAAAEAASACFSEVGLLSSGGLVAVAVGLPILLVALLVRGGWGSSSGAAGTKPESVKLAGSEKAQASKAKAKDSGGGITKANAKPNAKAAADAKNKAVVEPKAKAVAEPKANAVVEPKAKAGAEPKPKATADPKAKAKAAPLQARPVVLIPSAAQPPAAQGKAADSGSAATPAKPKSKKPKAVAASPAPSTSEAAPEPIVFPADIEPVAEDPPVDSSAISKSAKKRKKRKAARDEGDEQPEASAEAAAEYDEAQSDDDSDVMVSLTGWTQVQKRKMAPEATEEEQKRTEKLMGLRRRKAAISRRIKRLEEGIGAGGARREEAECQSLEACTRLLNDLERINGSIRKWSAAPGADEDAAADAPAAAAEREEARQVVGDEEAWEEEHLEGCFEEKAEEAGAEWQWRSQRQTGVDSSWSSHDGWHGRQQGGKGGKSGKGSQRGRGFAWQEGQSEDSSWWAAGWSAGASSGWGASGHGWSSASRGVSGGKGGARASREREGDGGKGSRRRGRRSGGGAGCGAREDDDGEFEGQAGDGPDADAEGGGAEEVHGALPRPSGRRHAGGGGSGAGEEEAAAEAREDAGEKPIRGFASLSSPSGRPQFWGDAESSSDEERLPSALRAGARPGARPGAATAALPATAEVAVVAHAGPDADDCWRSDGALGGGADRGAVGRGSGDSLGGGGHGGRSGRGRVRG